MFKKGDPLAKTAGSKGGKAKTEATAKRGFASMDKEKLRKLSKRAGKIGGKSIREVKLEYEEVEPKNK